MNKKGLKKCSSCEQWLKRPSFYGIKKPTSMCKPCYRIFYGPEYRKTLAERAAA